MSVGGRFAYSFGRGNHCGVATPCRGTTPAMWPALGRGPYATGAADRSTHAYRAVPTHRDAGHPPPPPLLLLLPGAMSPVSAYV